MGEEEVEEEAAAFLDAGEAASLRASRERDVLNDRLEGAGTRREGVGRHEDEQAAAAEDDDEAWAEDKSRLGRRTARRLEAMTATGMQVRTSGRAADSLAD